MEVKKAERAADIFLFILPQKELENTPSRKAGVSAEVEAEQRAVGCELIMDTGVLLSLPMICMSRAQVLLHRFFYRRSLTEFDVRAVAVAVLFLATKLEESPTKLRQVILTYQRVALRRAGYESPSADLPSIDVGSGAYFTVKDAIIEVERTALLELSFLMFVEHPHKYVLLFCRLLFPARDWKEISSLAHASWALVNDSLRSTLCCRFPAHVIATAAVYLAIRKLKMPFTALEWWRLFDTETEELIEVCKGIADAVNMRKPVYKELCKDGVALPAELRYTSRRKDISGSESSSDSEPSRRKEKEKKRKTDKSDKKAKKEKKPKDKKEKDKKRRRRSSSSSSESSDRDREKRYKREKDRDRDRDRRDSSRDRDRDRRDKKKDKRDRDRRDRRDRSRERDREKDHHRDRTRRRR
ncbi:Cyclin-L1-1 [Diplonema papillatum]|nr:Cyclin-L1-1 [Diplonema papillatum]